MYENDQLLTIKFVLRLRKYGSAVKNSKGLGMIDILKFFSFSSTMSHDLNRYQGFQQHWSMNSGIVTLRQGQKPSRNLSSRSHLYIGCRRDEFLIPRLRGSNTMLTWVLGCM
jgi:hypothetical protein